MPSAVMTFWPIALHLVVGRAASTRFVATNCGEIQRVRIASSTFG